MELRKLAQHIPEDSDAVRCMEGGGEKSIWINEACVLVHFLILYIYTQKRRRMLLSSA